MLYRVVMRGRKPGRINLKGELELEHVETCSVDIEAGDESAARAIAPVRLLNQYGLEPGLILKTIEITVDKKGIETARGAVKHTGLALEVVQMTDHEAHHFDQLHR